MATDRASWPQIERSAATEHERLFFDAHQWAVIDAACERIYPGNGGAGAHQARVVRFIDRYLSGLGFIFASPDGRGFLDVSGKDADAWRCRIERLQATYRDGVDRLDATARTEFGADFPSLEPARQDRVLEIVSGAPKPTEIRLGETGEAHVQNISDDALPFFDALALHTRQGMFCDPAYGGNHGRAGWALIGFPGPLNLEQTRDCSYGHPDAFLADFDWADLIPQLRTGRKATASPGGGQTANKTER